MKATVVIAGLIFAMLSATTSGAPQVSCGGQGYSCGSFYGGQCCGGLTCGPSMVCVQCDSTSPYPPISPNGYPSFAYFGGYGSTGPAIYRCGMNSF